MQSDSFLAPRSANHCPLTPVSLLWRTAELHPSRIGVVHGRTSLTWSDFATFVNRLGAGLSQRGIGPGDIVSILAPNCPEMLAMHFAVPAIGAVLNTINIRLDTETVDYILGHTQSTLLVVHRRCSEMVKAARVNSTFDTCSKVWIASGSDDADRSGYLRFDKLFAHSDIDMPQRISDEWQPIALNYTSGTTGRPKGVVYNHRGAFLNAIGNLIALGFSDRTRYLWVLPMFHCNGWTHPWAVTAVGGTHLTPGHPLTLAHVGCVE